MAKYMSTMFTNATDIWRKAVELDKLRERLQNHALGLIKMEATEIKAAEILLRKTIPDLKAIEHSGTVERRDAREYTDAELLAFLERNADTDNRRQRTVAAEASPRLAADVHRVHDA